MFFGCYVKPGFTSKMWNTNRGAGLLSLSLSDSIFSLHDDYSNFLGFTGLPDNKPTIHEYIFQMDFFFPNNKRDLESVRDNLKFTSLYLSTHTLRVAMPEGSIEY